MADRRAFKISKSLASTLADTPVIECAGAAGGRIIFPPDYVGGDVTAFTSADESDADASWVESGETIPGTAGTGYDIDNIVWTSLQIKLRCASGASNPVTLTFQ